MERRKFLSNISLSVGASLILNGIPLRILSKDQLGALSAFFANGNENILVLVQLSGGNDGLNTVIPLDQYAIYKNLRTNIALPENSILKLNNNTGIHPAMTKLKTLYDEGNVALVQGVSYPTPNFSHFRATDIWNSASSYNEYLSSGWLGRFLEIQYPGYPDSYPTTAMPDPLAIQIGAITSLSIQGIGKSMGIAITNPDTFYQLVNPNSGGSDTDIPNTAAGNELKFVRDVELKSQKYANSIKAAADKGKNQETYPTSNSLADQLKIVARLIAGGLKTRVYYVTLGGFDTHSNQVLTSDTKLGAHATLLQKLSEAFSAFLSDLKKIGVDKKVIAMTYSEFGRRVASNASYGTDHGTSEPVFIVGSGVSGGVIGVNSNLSDLANGNLKMLYDYRQIYTSIMLQWFGVSQKDLTSIITGSFQALPIIKAVQTVERPHEIENFILYQNYPNPFNASTMIEFDLNYDSFISLKIYDTKGAEVESLIEEYKNKGHYQVNFNAGHLSSGVYIYKIFSTQHSLSKRMILVK